MVGPGPPRLSTNVVTTGTSGNTLRYPCNPWYHLVLHPFNRCTFSTGSTVPMAPNSTFSTVEIVVRDCAQARVNDCLLLASLPCSGHGGAVSEKWGQSRVIGGLGIGGWLPSNSAHGAHGARGAQCTGRQSAGIEEDLGAIKDIHGGANLTQPRFWIAIDCNFLCFHHFLKRVLFVLFSGATHIYARAFF